MSTCGTSLYPVTTSGVHTLLSCLSFQGTLPVSGSVSPFLFFIALFLFLHTDLSPSLPPSPTRVYHTSLSICRPLPFDCFFLSGVFVSSSSCSN